MNIQKYILDAVKKLPLTRSIEKNMKLLHTALITLIVLCIVQILCAIIMSTYFMMEMIRA